MRINTKVKVTTALLSMASFIIYDVVIIGIVAANSKPVPFWEAVRGCYLRITVILLIVTVSVAILLYLLEQLKKRNAV